MTKEIDQRITSGWRRFGQLSTFLKDEKMPICLKRKIADTVILPAMKYGAVTWALTKHQKHKLAVAQRSMERAMINITRKDKIRNEVTRSRTKVKDIISRAEQTKGHVARMRNNQWATKTTEWRPREGKRAKGKPRRRWRDEIEEKAGSMWMRDAQDRDVWKEVWRPSASSGVNGYEEEGI